MMAINEKRAFEELKRAHFFNVSHRRANVNLGPPSRGFHLSVLGEIFFFTFSQKRQCPTLSEAMLG